MPQPFTRSWLPIYDACAQRPKLAAHIGRIAALWTYADYVLGSVLAEVLHIDARIGGTIYGAVKAEAARLAIIEAMADDCLSTELAQEYRKLRQRVKQTANERDNVVHGLWGLPVASMRSRQFFLKTGSLIWADPRDFVRVNAVWRSLLAKPEKDRTAKDRAYVEQLQNVRALEYKEADFVAIEERIQERINELSSFGVKVARFHER